MHIPFFIFIMSIPGLLLSQFAFQRTVPGVSLGTIIERQGGYRLFLSTPGYNDLILIGTDQHGFVKKQSIYGGSQGEFSAGAILAHGNGYLHYGWSYSFPVAGEDNLYKAYAVRLDTAGNVLWAKTYYYPDYHERNTQFLHGTATRDGGYLLAGSSCCDYEHDVAVGRLYPGLYLVKTDSMGQKQWDFLDTTLAAPGGYWRDICVLESPLGDGYYVASREVDSIVTIAGPVGSQDKEYDKYLLCKIDLQGNYVWKKGYYPLSLPQDGTVHSFNDIVLAADSTLTIVGGRILLGADLNGFELWRKEYPFHLYNAKMALAVGGGYAIAHGNHLTRVDETGEVIWQKNYDVDDFRAIIQTGDGGFAAYAHQSVMIKTDCEGNVDTPGFPCTTTSISTDIPSKVSLYPNPSRGIITVISSEQCLVKIELLDATGRIVVNSERMKQTSWEYEVKQLSKGVYCVKIETENGPTIIKKLIVE